jgi:hypothetical protein
MSGSAGVQGADAICAQEAAAEGLPGTFKALLSTTTQPAASRFELAGPTWARMDGVAIVQQATDIASERLSAPISLGADGRSYADWDLAWTGSASGREPISATCEDWTSDAAEDQGRTGRVFSAARDWFTSYAEPCSASHRVYCLEE